MESWVKVEKKIEGKKSQKKIIMFGYKTQKWKQNEIKENKKKIY